MYPLGALASRICWEHRLIAIDSRGSASHREAWEQLVRLLGES
jgi:hypothetical protein